MDSNGKFFLHDNNDDLICFGENELEFVNKLVEYKFDEKIG